MKKKLLSLILIVAMLPATANAKTTPYYTLKGTVHNFTYTQIYKDGTVIKGKGFDIYTTDGNIWEMTDTDTDYHFSENATVKVKFHNNKTPKDKTDDRIISVKKANKGGSKSCQRKQNQFTMLIVIMKLQKQADHHGSIQ